MLAQYLLLLTRLNIVTEPDMAVAPARRTANADYDTRPTWPSKDPDDHWDYSIDWSRLISDEADMIKTSVVKHIDGKVILTRNGYKGQVSTMWFKRGVEGVNRITVHIVTESGREGDQTIDLTIAQR